MEIITGIAASVFVIWLAWISLTTVQNKLAIQAMDKNDQAIIQSIGEVKTNIKGLSDRLDLFLRNELDELKKIAEK